MGISVSGSTSGASIPAGSPAQIAYDRAVKALTQAQRKLSQDGLSGASEEQLKADQQAVELAQIAVEQAAARLAQEQKAAEARSVPAVEQAPEAPGRLDVLA